MRTDSGVGVSGAPQGRTQLKKALKVEWFAVVAAGLATRDVVGVPEPKDSDHQCLYRRRPLYLPV